MTMDKVRYMDCWVDDLREQMGRVMSTLEKEGASKEEIKKYKKGFLQEIKNAEKHKKKQQAQVTAFLKIIGKENCPKSAQKLRQIFYSTRTDEGYWTLPVLPFWGIKAMEAIGGQYIRKANSDNPDYKKFHKKITGLRDALRDICQYMKDPDIQKYYEVRAYNDKEVQAHITLKSDEEFFEQVRGRGMQLDMFLFEGKKLGRPSLKEFYNFVYQLARRYEEISEQKFTVLRHRESDGKNAGEYVPITPGHEFIYEAVRWICEEFKDTDGLPDLRYTDKNIYNACEQAQKRLKDDKNGMKKVK
ncbi:MAG TPA: hypothetical protein PLK94_00275 [Alphaproteobacteria bacterium]|nr:hypothetical protein [Alphaproteobacteria bacterium]